MNQGIFLRCDPYAGWTVVMVDEYGNEQIMVFSCQTMEEALRKFTIQLNKPVQIKISPPTQG